MISTQRNARCYVGQPLSRLADIGAGRAGAGPGQHSARVLAEAEAVPSALQIHLAAPRGAFVCGVSDTEYGPVFKDLFRMRKGQNMLKTGFGVFSFM